MELRFTGANPDTDSITTTNLEWYANGLLKMRRVPGSDANGIIEQFTYNARQQVLTTTRGPITITNTYFDDGNLKTVSRNGKLLQEYTYDGFNRPKTIQHLTGDAAPGAGQQAPAEIEEFTYTAAGRQVTRVLKSTDGTVVSSVTTTYDPVGRVLETSADGDQVKPQQQNAYTQQGQAGGLSFTRLVTAPGLDATLNALTTGAVLPNGLAGAMTQPLVTTTPGYFPNLTLQNTASTEGSAGDQQAFTSAFTYNGLDHQITATDNVSRAGGAIPAVKYDRRPDGQATAVRDGTDVATTFSVTKDGQVTHTIRPNDVTISKELDTARRVTSNSDAEPRFTRFRYASGTDHLIGITALDGGNSTLSIFDPATDLPQRIEKPGGVVVITSTYDRKGRLLTLPADKGDDDFKTEVTQYDALDRIRSDIPARSPFHFRFRNRVHRVNDGVVDVEGGHDRTVRLDGGAAHPRFLGFWTTGWLSCR